MLHYSPLDKITRLGERATKHFFFFNFTTVRLKQKENLHGGLAFQSLPVNSPWLPHVSLRCHFQFNTRSHMSCKKSNGVRIGPRVMPEVKGQTASDQPEAQTHGLELQPSSEPPIRHLFRTHSVGGNHSVRCAVANALHTGPTYRTHYL